MAQRRLPERGLGRSLSYQGYYSYFGHNGQEASCCGCLLEVARADPARDIANLDCAMFCLCLCPGGGMADAEDLKSSGYFSSCWFDSHPGHQSFLLKMNEFLDRRFPCASGIPHSAKAPCGSRVQALAKSPSSCSFRERSDRTNLFWHFSVSGGPSRDRSVQVCARQVSVRKVLRSSAWTRHVLFRFTRFAPTLRFFRLPKPVARRRISRSSMRVSGQIRDAPGKKLPVCAVIKSPATASRLFLRTALRYIQAMRLLAAISITFLAVISAVVCCILSGAPFQLRASAQDSPTRTYLGFDLNTYPGDNALPILRKTFFFAGYWLSPPPGAKLNSWLGKRELLRAHGFGFLVLYRGPQGSDLKSEARAAQQGSVDARNAAATAKKEGFPQHTIIFLDIEEGGRLPSRYHSYLRAWISELERAGYRAGVYCSGMPVNEGGGVTIVTSDDIRHHLDGRNLVFWVYNDACPPSPGCAVPRNPPPPSASEIPYAAVWQFAQSPRRKEFTSRCAATYHTDVNFYDPGDTGHAWFLDVNTATTSDPSQGRN